VTKHEFKFQRYTKHILATGYLYVHVGNVQGIPNPKRMERKYGVLDELFKEQVSMPCESLRLHFVM
jgi:hypothetical protein